MIAYREGMIRLQGVEPGVAASIIEDLTFQNPQYEQAQRAGEDTSSISPVILAYRHIGADLLVPRYFPLHRYVRPRIVDVAPEAGGFVHTVVTAPRAAQGEVIQELDALPGDVGLELPCGFGKSFLALRHAAHTPGRILIVAPTQVKLEEWKAQVTIHLGLPLDRIGHVQASTRKWEEFPVVVTMLKSMATQDFPPEFLNGFSTVVWDEIHLGGAPVMSQALGRVNGKQIQLTATPGRGVRREILALHGGLAWVSRQMDNDDTSFNFFVVPAPAFAHGKEWRVQKMACAKDRRYIGVAAKFTANAVAAGRRVLVLAGHIDPLVGIRHHLLTQNLGKPGFVIGAQSLKDVLYAEVTAAFPDKSWAAAARAYQEDAKLTCNPILATGLTKTQPGGMGMDVPDLDGGVVLFPVGDRDMTQQMVGRWARHHPTKKDPVGVVLVPQTNEGISIGRRMRENMNSMGVTTRWAELPNGF